MGVGFKPYDPGGSAFFLFLKKSAKRRLDGSLAHRCLLASPLGATKLKKQPTRGNKTQKNGYNYIYALSSSLPLFLPPSLSLSFTHTYMYLHRLFAFVRHWVEIKPGNISEQRCPLLHSRIPPSPLVPAITNPSLVSRWRPRLATSSSSSTPPRRVPASSTRSSPGTR